MSIGFASISEDAARIRTPLVRAHRSRKWKSDRTGTAPLPLGSHLLPSASGNRARLHGICISLKPEMHYVISSRTAVIAMAIAASAVFAASLILTFMFGFTEDELGHGPAAERA